MSAGVFEVTGYQMNNGSVVPIRVQPETQELTIDGGANVGVTAGLTRSFGSARVSGSARQLGIRARGVYIRFTGAVPDGYEPNQILRVPILNLGFYNGIDRFDTGEYLGSPVEVVGKYAESVR